ncbi:MAG TPA: alpha-amylase family glycosyl hydrolase [Ignavibacteriaceae bacterium]|jgi:glycosidase|nr:MAG: Alpha-amylase 2 [Ignavibacteria bacterium ADurb.Bin266]OQY69594.1 MAG: alpha-amylase [Ignavibacteriales bacterium UTCHB2]HQF41861.1 alpha-amylase family glycosyl hydrolase [Ignavibacteriaceae bacterium]HQI40507.1 alpha-amylase family glycosyl hydrolase [Ignavibacteriaceae bacterium]HQJ45471.1 alpha-amylase family glycosyl hydrolase [Ignavibacteriaceae bacterium]
MKKYLSFFLLFILFPQYNFSQPKAPFWAKNATIYEVNIRQFTKEGTFKSFQQHLTRLKELGVDILWLMPINPIGELNRKGTLGSYYSIKDYVDVNPEFGTKENFKTLVDEIHNQGMYIIIDWVANHTAWDNKWVKTNPEFYTKDSSGNFIPPVPDWSDVIDLNYDNKELWKEMISALEYWLNEFDIDGYRCDVAGMIPVEFWNEARFELDKMKPVFMLAEWDTPEMHKHAFDMTYDWDLHKIFNGIYLQEKNSNDIIKHILKDLKNYPDYAYRMQFTSNHDENSWNGTEFERLGEAAEVFAVLTYIIPGMPLIYNGQESGFNKRLEFFEKDSIIWQKNKYEKLYKNLNELKDKNKALWTGAKRGSIDFINNDNDILIIKRRYDENEVIGFFNLTEKEINTNIFSGKLTGTYNDFNTGESIELNNNFQLKLNPWSYKIYFK